MLKKILSFKFKLLGITLLLMAMLFTGTLLWVITAPRSFSWLNGYVEEQLNHVAEGYHVKIKQSMLRWDGWETAFGIDLRGLEVSDVQNHHVASFPEVKLGINLLQILRGDTRFTSLTIVKPSFDISTAGATASYQQENKEADIMLTAFFGFLKESNSVDLSLLPERISISDAVLNINNGTKTVVWKIPDGYVKLKGEVKQGEMTVDFGTSKSQITVKTHEATSDNALPSIEVAIDHIPSNALLDLFPDTAILKGINVEAALKSDIIFNEQDKIEKLQLKITHAKGELSLPDYFPETLQLKSASIKADMDVPTHTVKIEDFVAEFPGAKFGGAGSISNQPNDANKVRLAMDTTLNLLDVKAADLKYYWPLGLGVEARDWVTTHLVSGKVTKASIRAITKPEDYDTSEPLPISAIDATIAFDGVKAHIAELKGLPDITDLEGTAKFDAHAMRIKIKSGSILSSHIREAKVTIPDLWKDDPPMVISGDVNGSAHDVLEVVKVFAPKDKNDALELTQFNSIGGNATTSFTTTFPLADVITNKDISFTAKSKLSNGTLDDFLKKIKVTDAALELQADNNAFSVSGKALFNGIPADITAKEPFKQKILTYSAKAEASPEELLALGIGHIPNVQGKIALDISGTLDKKSNRFGGTADISDAKLVIPSIGYTKKHGVKWVLNFTAKQANGGKLNVSKLNVKSKGFTASGSGIINLESSGFEKLTLSPLRFAKNNLQKVEYHSTPKQVSLFIKGKQLDLSKAKLRGILQPSSSTVDKHTLILSLDTATLLLKNDESLRKFAMNLKCDEVSCNSLDIYGKIHENNYVVANIKPTGKRHTLMVESDNAGALLSALDISNHIQNGTLSVSAVMDTEKGKAVAGGVIRMHDFIAVKTPLLGKLLTLASFQGIVDALEGKGINFKKFEAPFALQDGIITVSNAKSSGSSVGITAEGTINTNTDILNLNGTVIPAQGVNNLINNIPVVGSLISGGKDQGFFATRYSIKGPIEDAEISVNPLSIITPGILRNVFDLFPDSAPKAQGPEPSDEMKQQDQKLDNMLKDVLGDEKKD